MLTQEALQAWYGSHEADLDWLDKPSRHQFRWRLPNDRWATANRQFSSPKALQKELKKQGPRDVYVGTSAWLTPIDLPKRSDTDVPHPVLIDHMVVFDIDFTPFSYRRPEQAGKPHIGSSLGSMTTKTSRFAPFPTAAERGFTSSSPITTDPCFQYPTRRNERKPYEPGDKFFFSGFWTKAFPLIQPSPPTHGVSSAFQGVCMERPDGCTRITREQLATPLKSWVRTIEKHRWPNPCAIGPTAHPMCFVGSHPRRPNEERRPTSNRITKRHLLRFSNAAHKWLEQRGECIDGMDTSTLEGRPRGSGCPAC